MAKKIQKSVFETQTEAFTVELMALLKKYDAVLVADATAYYLREGCNQADLFVEFQDGRTCLGGTLGEDRTEIEAE